MNHCNFEREETKKMMTTVRFELTLFFETVLKTVAFDRSATLSLSVRLVSISHPRILYFRAQYLEHEK